MNWSWSENKPYIIPTAPGLLQTVEQYFIHNKTLSMHDQTPPPPTPPEQKWFETVNIVYGNPILTTPKIMPRNLN